MIKFLKFTSINLTISCTLIVLSLLSMWTYGFNYSIDFVGGASTEIVGIKNEKIARQIIQKEYPNATIQKSNTSILVKVKSMKKKEAETLVKKIGHGATLGSYEIISPSVSKENIIKTTTAFLIAALCILVYVTYSFGGVLYAVAAIIAMFHDTTILLGVWSFLGARLGAQFDILFVTSLLTIMSFSVHDTIIIFDKLKEEENSGRYHDLKDKINAALTLTIVRSTNTSITTILVLAALVVLGGGATRWFSVALLTGMILGTYSSPFIAAPVYYFLTNFFKRRHK